MQFFPRICLKCRKVVNIPILQQLNCLSDYAVKRAQENSEILVNLGYSKEETVSLLSNRRVSSKNLKRAVHLLQRLGYTTEDIYKNPKILEVQPGVIEHRFKALEESGFIVKKISLHLLRKKPGLFIESIHQLKKEGLIDSNTEVVHNILSFSGTPPELYPPEDSDHLPYNLAQVLAKKTYLAWKFNFSEDEIVKKLKFYPLVRYKSVRILNLNYDCLRNVFQMPKEKIILNFFLMHGHFEDYLEILECFPTITKFPAHTAIMMHPRILLQKPAAVMEISSILKDYNLPTQSLRLLLPLFTLQPKTVRERIEKLWSDPAFRPYFHSPRLSKMILYFDKTTTRYKFLEEANWRHKSLFLLSSDEKGFISKYKLGDDMNKGNDVIHMLRKELGIKTSAIRKLLLNHPMWFCIPIGYVADTLEYLREAGFQKSYIASALPIVLFDKNEVKKCLEQLDSQPEVECCRGTSGQIREELVLQLALYYLERPFHFTGKSIWKNFKNNKVTSIEACS